jgi:membrane fusion protein, peptide pheromone/bacteriocin exporter
MDGAVSKINVEEKNYIIIAPISGTIENFSGLQVGSFINIAFWWAKAADSYCKSIV